MCEPIRLASGSQMMATKKWTKPEVKNYKMELLLRYIWRVVESDPNIDFKTLQKWVPLISKCGCGIPETNKSLKDKLVCNLLKLWQSMGGGLNENEISYLLLFIESTRKGKKRLNFVANFNRLKIQYNVKNLKEQEILCVEEGCVQHMQELDNLLQSVPKVNVEDAVHNIHQLQEKNGYCVKDLSSLETMENDLELQIKELERGDGEYMDMLTQADEMWLDMEHAFQQSIEVSKEMKDTLSTEFDLAELSLSKWKEKCVIAEDDEKKALEINEQLQSETDDNTRQSQVMEQQLVELGSLSAQVNKNLQNMKKDYKDAMKNLRMKKDFFLKNIPCYENEISEKRQCTKQKCKLYNEKILDARNELAKCCKYFLQQSQQREELRGKTKNMNNEKITCAKRCLESKVFIDSQKQNIISEIAKMRDDTARIFPAKSNNICDCNSVSKKCNCGQCKQQNSTFCCCTDLKHHFFRNVFKDLLSRIRSCNCEADGGFVDILNSVLQCNTSPMDENRLLKIFLLDLMFRYLDISVSEGLQATRDKVPMETRANVCMCLDLPEEKPTIASPYNEYPAEEMKPETKVKNKDLGLEYKSESNKDSVEQYHNMEYVPEKESKTEYSESTHEDLESDQIERLTENLEPETSESHQENFESVKAELESEQENLESVKSELESEQENLESVKSETEFQNEDIDSVKDKFESQIGYSESANAESKDSDEVLESDQNKGKSKNQPLELINDDFNFQSEDLESVKVEFETRQEDLNLKETHSISTSYSVNDDIEKVSTEPWLGIYGDVQENCECDSFLKFNAIDELGNCHCAFPKSNILPNFDKSNVQAHNKKPSVNILDTCNCSNDKNICIKCKLLDCITSIQGKIKDTYTDKQSQTGRVMNRKYCKYLTYHPNNFAEIDRSEYRHYCNCTSELRRRDFSPRKSRPCKKKTMLPPYRQCGKFNVSPMYCNILARTKEEFRKFISNSPYAEEYERELSLKNYLPKCRSKREFGDNVAKSVKPKRLPTENNNVSEKQKIINNLERCLQARILHKVNPEKQKCKAMNTEMVYKNIIFNKKRKIRNCQPYLS